MAPTSSSQLKNICVLFGFRYGKYKEFVQAAIDLGRVIAERKLHLVCGGGDRGLSKLVSEVAFVRGSQVLGIIPKALKPLGCLPDSPTREELVVSGDLVTLESLITFASWAHLNVHKKPIVKKLFIWAPTANELLDLLQAYKPESDPMTLALDWATDDDGTNSRKKWRQSGAQVMEGLRHGSGADRPIDGEELQFLQKRFVRHLEFALGLSRQ
ncbi:cytokinin riboside 5'-monophosphate phosphoribohydrolase LOG7-like [Citrus sinensis]|uniref:cytokinin riboside 5'-monophosphate phosphoribohydrolase LOG7-like n=1 Tax=Citrus clementina TaxID=85681 RepID=UPI000CED0F00|nr:cytokinin riboside 5'-monophosphate phosphoribohydrolase LOG7-like [Citrus x clementina]XP_052299709.1 cytokinin riboside 5'-monophosphate phosphoribohydrolase LOG7-like [Citrus sinensis]